MKKEPKNWSIIDVIRWGTQYFNDKNIDSPRLTIELMLSDILQIERITLYTNFDKPLKENELFKLKEYIKRRINREPLQFILGKTKFYNCELHINNTSIVPRPETEILVEAVNTFIKNDNNINRVLDIGTGSGCIAISIAKEFPFLDITAIDISEFAINLAKQNAIFNNVENINFYEIDILNQLPDGQYDLIVSNPPYIPIKEYEQLEPEILNYEPGNALTDYSDGLTFYRRFAEIFGRILNHPGSFFLEVGYNQAEMVSEIFKKNGYRINFINDLNLIKRIVFGRN